MLQPGYAAEETAFLAVGAHGVLSASAKKRAARFTLVLCSIKWYDTSDIMLRCAQLQEI